MGIRSTYQKQYDIQDVIKAMFDDLAAASGGATPFTDWEIILNFPDQKIQRSEADSGTTEGLVKPILYVEEPTKIRSIKQAGGALSGYDVWNMQIGFWLMRHTGGKRETTVFEGAMNYWFNDYVHLLNRRTITVTIGATTYTDKTLLELNVPAKGLVGMTAQLADDPREFRKEATIEVYA